MLNTARTGNSEKYAAFNGRAQQASGVCIVAMEKKRTIKMVLGGE